VTGDENDARDSVALNRYQLVLALLSGLALLALNVIQFAFILYPRWAPDPGAQFRASIEPLAVEPHVTRVEHLERLTGEGDLRQAQERAVREELGPDADRREICARMPELLGRPGWVVYASISAEGLKRRRVLLSGTLYDGKSDARLEQFGSYGATGLESVPRIPGRRLASPSDTFVETIFVPMPALRRRKEQTFYVQLELRTETAASGAPGTLLDSARTPKFRSYDAKELPELLLPRCHK
jgi:hypothetical protein